MVLRWWKYHNPSQCQIKPADELKWSVDSITWPCRPCPKRHTCPLGLWGGSISHFMFNTALTIILFVHLLHMKQTGLSSSLFYLQPLVIIMIIFEDHSQRMGCDGCSKVKAKGKQKVNNQDVQKCLLIWIKCVIIVKALQWLFQMFAFILSPYLTCAP